MSDLFSALKSRYDHSEPGTATQEGEHTDAALVPGWDLLDAMSGGLPLGSLRPIDHAVMVAYHAGLPDGHERLDAVRALLSRPVTPEAAEDGRKRARTAGFLSDNGLTPSGRFQAQSILSRR